MKLSLFSVTVDMEECAVFYKQNRSPRLSEELFKSPTSEYRATPFWAWNCDLEKGELLRQIEVFKKMGLGGFHMHVRSGLATPYLGDEHLSLVKACVEKARQEDMLAYLYDEDRWPSGAAGGLVTREDRHRQKELRLTTVPYKPENRSDTLALSEVEKVRTEEGSLIACFGSVHNADRTMRWLGPNAWRTTGDSWCYEYILKEMGILSTPVVWEER